MKKRKCENCTLLHSVVSTSLALEIQKPSTVRFLNKMCNLLICCYAHKLGENAVVSVAM